MNETYKNVLSFPYEGRQDIVYHPELKKKILHYAQCDDIMHTLFYGPPCSGKLHLARVFISIHTGIDVQKGKRIIHNYKAKDKTFPFYKSSVHFEIDVNHFTNTHQKYLMNLIQELARTLNVSRNTYKIILLRHTEKLTKNIQHQLRRMMELFYATCRLIMLTTSLDQIDTTIQSRLVSIRLPAIQFNLHSENKHFHVNWLKQLLNDKQCIDILSDCVRQLWRLLNKKKLSSTSLRKWVRLIQFTRLDHIEIIHLLYNKICIKLVHEDSDILLQLLALINYYLYMQDIGNGTDFQLEIIFYIMYVSLHNQPLLHMFVKKSRIETY